MFPIAPTRQIGIQTIPRHGEFRCFHIDTLNNCSTKNNEHFHETSVPDRQTPHAIVELDDCFGRLGWLRFVLC